MLDADRTALADLVHRYAAGVDDRQFDRVTTLFTEKAELVNTYVADAK
jgi:3-phenylpropionate/cinnamic acid dioxygenase small subunit